MAASAAYIPGVSLSDKLRLAASKGQVDKVHELIKAGADFEADREGRTAFHYASLNGHAEIVQILADEGADINSQDTLGYTALHRAAAQGHLEVIKVLLAEGCLVDRQDQHGNSPAHEAAWNGYSKTLELLIRHKANVHCINKAGFTALHLAAQNGHNQSARVLLYAGCNPDLRNNYGDSALHTAARYGHAGVTRILVSARCNISEQNKNGDTGLHISAALKRRKLSKLLVESGINTSLRNKQNETAVDVARRKEHPEIILIITAQQSVKNGKKSKKKDKLSKKDKGSKQVLNGEEEPEKKGLFFRKKSKPKVSEAEKQKAAEANAHAKPPDYKPRDFPPVAPSEISSSEFNSQMAPEDLLRGFRQHQGSHATHPKEVRRGDHGNQGVSTRGTTARGQKKIQGLVTEYAPKTGVQYYKDLAGNVRQGPIGYAPVCNCQPVIKKMEKRMEADRNNLYDHIDASHKTLANRIETLDKRTTNQVFSIDKLTKERLDMERKTRDDYIHSCIRKERMEAQENCEHRHVEMKQELHGYLDHRFTNYERYHAATMDRNDPCYRCHDDEHPRRPRYHDDDMVNMVYDPSEPPMPGRLYKSKSDETLSVASSHPSRRHWKMKTSGLRDITDLKLARVHDKARRLERKIRSKSAAVRAPSVEQLNHHRDSSVPVHRHSRMPEGNSGSDLHNEYQTYKDFVDRQHQWNAKRNPVDVGMTQQLDQPVQDGYSSLRRGTTLQNVPQNHYNSLRRGKSQEVKVEVHQNRPRSASQTNNPPVVNGHGQHPKSQYGNSTGDLYGNENSRTRSNSAVRVPDGAAQSIQQRPPSLSDIRQSEALRQSQSAYNMGNVQPPVKSIPHSASYDSSTSRQQQQPHRATSTTARSVRIIHL